MSSVSDVATVPLQDGHFRAQRLVLPSSGLTAWTLIGPDRRRVDDVDAYLAWLTNIERSPNTVEAYARDLKSFFTFLSSRALRWEDVRVRDLGDYVASLRRPADNVIVLERGQAARDPKTVNRMVTAVVGFYEFHARNGHELAERLVDETRKGYGSYKPFLYGMAPLRPRARVVRLPEPETLPTTLTIGQIDAIIRAQTTLRDRLLLSLLACAGLRIGQALGLRHEDILSWDKAIRIKPRINANGARRKGNREDLLPCRPHG